MEVDDATSGEGGGGGGGEGHSTSFIRGASNPPRGPYPCYPHLPFLIEKVPISYTCTCVAIALYIKE